MNTDYYTGRAPAISAISSTLINVPEKIAAVTELGGWPTPPGGVYDKPTAFRGYTATGIWLSPRGLKSSTSSSASSPTSTGPPTAAPSCGTPAR